MPNTSTMLVGKTLGICFDAEPNHSSTVAWRISRIPSEATSLASGDDVRSGRKTSSSLEHANDDRHQDRDDDGRGRRQREAEVVGLERPERVRGDHRDGAGGEVDDPRAAVRHDHGHRDPGDHRARPEAEQDEENDVLHDRFSIVCSASWRVIGKAGGLLSDPPFRRTHEVAGQLPTRPLPLYL